MFYLVYNYIFCLILYLSILFFLLGDQMNRGLKTKLDVISQLEDTASAFESGPNSATGKRRAYEQLVFQQRETYGGQCHVTLFSLISSYSISRLKDKTFPSPPLLVVNSDGLINDSVGTTKFVVGDIVFTRLRKDCVVNLCPYVPVNDSDERSCYSTILVHIPWPSEGEDHILRGYASAVECLHHLKTSNYVPGYVRYTLELLHQSNLIRENVGTVTESHDNESNDGMYYDSEGDDCVLDSRREIDNISPEGCSHILSDEDNNDGLSTNLSRGNKQFFREYINNQQKSYLSQLLLENTAISSLNDDQYNVSSNNICPVNNMNERMESLSNNVKRLTEKQLKAYNIAVDYISGNKGSQMLMFVTGEGGTGKSFLISLIMEYTQIRHGKQGGLFGSALSIAPTGAAANVIKGYTWQSVYGKGIYRSKDPKAEVMSSTTAQAVGAKVLGVKLIVLDEISMITLDTLNEISERQIAAMCSQTTDESLRKYYRSNHFGGVHMLFTGDFYQLKPIGEEAIYTRDIKYGKSKKGKLIWDDLNEYIVLTENTRYMGDSTPIMNLFLSGARRGIVNRRLLNAMNDRIMYSEDIARRKAGPDAVWIVHDNSEVNRLNDLDYKEKSCSGVRHYVIAAKHLPTSTSTRMPNSEKCEFLQKIYRKNSAPAFLKLAIGSKVSCTKNLGTQIGTFICFLY